MQDNILFGRPYDQQQFEKAVFGACLEDDLKVLPGGPLSEIGERGINLSGGQKARVSLARAIYSDADIYLLDDPISAVDAHVGMHIIEHCLLGVLKHKTVLLVTHHLPILPKCDMIVILEDNGTVKVSGSYDEIMNSGIEVGQYLGAKGAHGDSSGTAKSELSVVSKAVPEKEVKSEEEKKEGDLMTKEERNDGGVLLSTYWTFIHYGGLFMFFVTIFAQAACQVLGIEANFWLADWGKETSILNYYQGANMSIDRNMYWFHGYCGMQMASIFCLFVSRMALNYHRTRSAARLHETCLTNVMSLPVSFFDVTPVGRIINRFSQGEWGFIYIVLV